METMGQVFKTARERKRISLSQAAAKTRIKMQHLEMMERDDFSQMPAPAYARGFIRMYADFLGLESAPLVQEYNELHQRGARPRVIPREPAPPPKAEEVESTDAPATPRAPSIKATQLLAVVLTFLSPANLKRAGIVVAMLLACWLLVVGVSRCARSVQQEDSSPHSPSLRKGVPAVVQEPADSYLPLPNSSGDSP